MVSSHRAKLFHTRNLIRVRSPEKLRSIIKKFLFVLIDPTVKREYIISWQPFILFSLPSPLLNSRCGLLNLDGYLFPTLFTLSLYGNWWAVTCSRELCLTKHGCSAFSSYRFVHFSVLVSVSSVWWKYFPTSTIHLVCVVISTFFEWRLNMFRLSERPERNNIIHALVTCVLGKLIFETMKPNTFSERTASPHAYLWYPCEIWQGISCPMSWKWRTYKTRLSALEIDLLFVREISENDFGEKVSAWNFSD